MNYADKAWVLERIANAFSEAADASLNKPLTADSITEALMSVGRTLLEESRREAVLASLWAEGPR